MKIIYPIFMKIYGRIELLRKLKINRRGHFLNVQWAKKRMINDEVTVKYIYI